MYFFDIFLIKITEKWKEEKYLSFKQVTGRILKVSFM